MSWEAGAGMRPGTCWSVEQGPRPAGMLPRKHDQGSRVKPHVMARSRVAPAGRTGRHCSAVRELLTQNADTMHSSRGDRRAEARA